MVYGECIVNAQGTNASLFRTRGTAREQDTSR